MPEELKEVSIDVCLPGRASRHFDTIPSNVGHRTSVSKDLPVMLTSAYSLLHGPRTPYHPQTPLS